MKITVSDIERDGENIYHFSDFKTATKCLKDFRMVIENVELSGKVGIAVAYWIMNLTESMQDYYPPNITYNGSDPEEQKKICDIVDDITSMMSRKFKGKK